jgi:apolipoprotein D and lipocalin family protein
MTPHSTLRSGLIGEPPARRDGCRALMVAVAAAACFACLALSFSGCATGNTSSHARETPQPSSGESPPLELPTVPVDLPRYMGRWYTIASIPYLNEREFVGSYAEWTLRPDGRIEDRFYGHRFDFDQPLTSGRLIARVVSGSHNAKWRVRFFWPFDVLVVTVYVDPDYRYTIRCLADGDLVWVLSRTPDIDERVYAELVHRLADMGIQTERLRRVPQHPDQLGQPGFMPRSRR